MGDVTASRNITGGGLLMMSDSTKEHPISNVYIGRQFSTTSYNYGLSVGSSFDVSNNFVVTRDVSNNITVINSPAEVWTNINNNRRLTVANESIEFYPADGAGNGNLRFSSNNASTRLYQTNNISGADVFANDTNVYMDFFTQNKDYDVRLQFQRRNASVGQGWFDCFAYRGRFWYGTQKMLEWGFFSTGPEVDRIDSFIRGASGITWIQFSSNTEIYYNVNGILRFTMGSNGYHYATLHVNTSDKRLKKNIVDVSGALQTINTLQVKEFDKKCSLDCDDVCEETIHQIGFIAQEVQRTDLSFCVCHSQRNHTLCVASDSIYALNVKATQELYAMVMKQQELLRKQQEEIINLSQRLSQIEEKNFMA